MVADAGGWPPRRRWRDGRGRAGDQTTVAKTNGGAGDEDEETAGSRAPVHLYRGGPFSTGPWLETVLKGPFSTGWCYEPVLKGPFSTGSSHGPVLKSP